MKTLWLKESEISRKWNLVDLNGVVLGRAASNIAGLLIGKGKVNIVPNMDCGDYVIAVNAAKIVVTGKKLKDKIYSRHSGYPGGLKRYSLEHRMKTKPEGVIIDAVKNMLPNNKLRDRMLARLYVYASSEHPHAAQKPEVADIKS